MMRVFGWVREGEEMKKVGGGQKAHRLPPAPFHPHRTHPHTRLDTRPVGVARQTQARHTYPSFVCGELVVPATTTLPASTCPCCRQQGGNAGRSGVVRARASVPTRWMCSAGCRRDGVVGAVPPPRSAFRKSGLHGEDLFRPTPPFHPRDEGKSRMGRDLPHPRPPRVGGLLGFRG